MSVDVVADVVNGPGHFLGARQTMELMESEFVYPRHADRSSPDDWARAGETDMRDRAAVRAKEVLDTHYPELIEPEVDARIRDRYAIHLDPTWSRRQACARDEPGPEQGTGSREVRRGSLRSSRATGEAS